MDAAQLLAALRRHWAYEATDKEISHEIYHDDAVLEFPQSQERFEGKANFIAWRKRYPAVLEFKIRRIRGGGNFWVAENSIRYDGGAWHYSCSILEFSGDKVARKQSTSHRLGGSRLASALARYVAGRGFGLTCGPTGDIAGPAGFQQCAQWVPDANTRPSPGQPGAHQRFVRRVWTGRSARRSASTRNGLRHRRL